MPHVDKTGRPANSTARSSYPKVSDKKERIAAHDHTSNAEGGALAAKLITRSVSLHEQPVLAVRSVILHRFEYAATLVKVHHEVHSAGTATWQLEIRTGGGFGAATDVFASGKVSTTTEQSEASFDTAAIPAGAHLVFVPTSKTGTPDHLTVTPVWTIN